MAGSILAIESSCDETAAAVVIDERVVSSVVYSQVAIHREFGGVVPELASRHHLDAIVPVVRQALREAAADFTALDALAVTEGPGLIGALLVGVQAARGLAVSTGLPLYGIHHLEGHLFSAMLNADGTINTEFEPHLALLVSGGHTELVAVEGLGHYRILGATRDDAAGEAYDKVAKLLGLGYPGGPVIDELALAGDPTALQFPRAMLGSDQLEFSFSGLKTAVAVFLDRQGQPQTREQLVDICASFQAAVVDVLVEKCRRGIARTGMRRLHVVGGVAANRGLAQGMRALGAAEGLTVTIPPAKYCGDNAAMIAAAARARRVAGLGPSVDVHAGLALDHGN